MYWRAASSKRFRLSPTFLLHFLQSGRVLLALTAQTVFLDAEIVELALVGQENFCFDEEDSKAADAITWELE